MVKNRLKETRNILGLSQEAFANKIGIAKRTLINYEQGKNSPTIETLIDIANKCNISSNWLLTGKHNPFPMTLNATINPENPKKSEVKWGLTHAANEDTVYIDDYKDVALSAGGGSYPDEHALAIGKRAFNLSWLKKKGLNPKDLSLVRVMGDSMEPLLKDKDMAMIDTSRTHPNDKMPFACIWEDELYIKLIQPKQPKIIKLVSVNKSYDPMEVDLSWQNFKIIGAVVWHAHSWI